MKRIPNKYLLQRYFQQISTRPNIQHVAIMTESAYALRRKKQREFFDEARLTDGQRAPTTTLPSSPPPISLILPLSPPSSSSAPPFICAIDFAHSRCKGPPQVIRNKLDRNLKRRKIFGCRGKYVYEKFGVVPYVR